MTNFNYTAGICAVIFLFAVNNPALAAIAIAIDDTHVLHTLRTYIKQQNYTPAYELAKKNEAELSGIPEFDYLFGIAAANNGKPAEAIFPLERVLLVNAKNHRARLDLALAQYIMGDLVAARQNFELVKQDNPPENVKHNIDVVLAKIEDQANKEGVTLVKNVGLTVGYDSNINTINATTSIITPTITLTLDDEDRKRADHFSTLDLGVRSNYPLSKMRSLFAAVNLKEHMHAKYRRYDQSIASFEAGPEIRNDYGVLKLPLQADYIYVDRNAFQHAWRVGADWTRKLNAITEQVVFSSLARNRFSAQPEQDNTAVLFGTGFMRDLKSLPLVGVVHFAYKKEQPRFSEGSHNGKGSLSTEFKWIYLHNDNNAGFVSLSLSRERYQEVHPVFVIYRRDNAANFALGWRMQVAKNLFFTPQGFYLRNRSNIQIYDYSRIQLGFNVGYLF